MENTQTTTTNSDQTKQNQQQDNKNPSPSISPKTNPCPTSFLKENLFINTTASRQPSSGNNIPTNLQSNGNSTISSPSSNNVSQQQQSPQQQSDNTTSATSVKTEIIDKKSAITKAFNSLASAASCKSKYGHLLVNETDLNTQLTAEKTHWAKLNGVSMVDGDQIDFSIQPSPSVPFTENFVLQSASRLLLNSLEWIKSSNNAFKLLDIDVQTVLLQKNWFDLFALSMSQCAKNLSLSTILTNINYQFQSNFNQGKLDRTKFLMIKEQLFYLQTFINECGHLSITPVEYAYLKLISLFDYGKIKTLCFAFS